QLELASFPQLEVLKIGKVKLRSAIKLIEKTEGNLSEILLGCTIYDEKYSGSFLRTIYKYCPNIQVLSLGINNVIDFKELVTLLRNCKQIRKIIVDRSKESGREHTILLLGILSIFSSKTLCEIRISSKWKVLARDLELFFENWKGRIPITMYFSVDLYAKFYFAWKYLINMKKMAY
ncbi:12350_t:CDS:1, partial [Funneliformis geosporum]